MKDYRRLTEDEVLQLKSQSCLADDWGNVLVAEGFNCEFVHHTRLSLIHICQATVSREISKLHEETVRGSLAELIEHFTATEPRGEIVIVLAGIDD